MKFLAVFCIKKNWVNIEFLWSKVEKSIIRDKTKISEVKHYSNLVIKVKRDLVSSGERMQEFRLH